MSGSYIKEWTKAQQLKGPSMKSAPVFYRNLEEELDVRRKQHTCYMPYSYLHYDTVDFSSTDILDLSDSGSLRAAFLEELAKYPDFHISPHGSRLAGGSSIYMDDFERQLAEFHGAEAALLFHTGANGNGAIFSAIPLAGDAIVYDELVHASILDGMKNSRALCQKSFRHNDVDSFTDVLTAIVDSQSQIRNGSKSVIISVESLYSMDGDICPLKELIEAAKEILPHNNAQFVIDEAHSTGVIGPKGAGLVNALGLEKDVAIRLHTFGKALAAAGAVVLCNNTVRSMLLNHAKSIMYSYSPSFLIIAAAQAAYSLLESGKTQQAQDRAQYAVKHFVKTLAANPIWQRALDAGLLRMPLYEDEDIESLPFVGAMVPIWTRSKHNLYLAFHVNLAGSFVLPIAAPVVPKGTDRIRIIFRASHSDAQVEELATSICVWAEEMLQLEGKGQNGAKMPAAARQVYTLMANTSR